MKVVLDTNVLVSGLLNPHGTPGRIVDGVLQGALQVLWDDRIRDEYEDVLHRPALHLSADLVGLTLQAIAAQAETILTKPWTAVLPVPDDAVFLEVALAGQADALITGNRKDFPSSASRGVRVLSPAEFIRFWSL